MRSNWRYGRKSIASIAFFLQIPHLSPFICFCQGGSLRFNEKESFGMSCINVSEMVETLNGGTFPQTGGHLLVKIGISHFNDQTFSFLVTDVSIGALALVFVLFLLLEYFINFRREFRIVTQVSLLVLYFPNLLIYDFVCESFALYFSSSDEITCSIPAPGFLLHCVCMALYIWIAVAKRLYAVPQNLLFKAGSEWTWYLEGWDEVSSFVRNSAFGSLRKNKETWYILNSISRKQPCRKTNCSR